jgi:hypothetical protein
MCLQLAINSRLIMGFGRRWSFKQSVSISPFSSWCFM